MSLCINPKCQNPDNPDNLLYCQSCQSELLLEGRYRVRSLLGEGGFAKTYEVSDRTSIPNFGIVREITGTYEQKQAAGQVTKVVSDGYSPLEQVIGSAVPQSDFFALGRTFVHLLTGEHPLNLGDQYRHDIYTDELEDWRDKAPQISSIFGDFIDQLMARPIQKRPADTQAILAQLAEIQQTLYSRKLSNTISSQVVPILNKPNFTLERTLGSWSSDHFKPVGCLAISPDGELLVSGNGNIIKAWNLNTGTEMYTVTEHKNGVLSLAISLDGQYLVSGSNDSSIKVWKLRTGELLRTFEDNHGSVYSIAISPDGQNLISGSHDGFTTLWNVNTGEKIRTLFEAKNSVNYTNSVRCVAVSLDGNILVSGYSSGMIQSSPRCSFNGHSGYISSVVITPNGKRLISSSSDRTIMIWSLITGDKIDTLTGHIGVVTSLAVSPNGELLVSGGADKTLKLWDLNTRKEVHTITVRSRKAKRVR